MRRIVLLLFGLCLTIGVVGCKKEETPAPAPAPADTDTDTTEEGAEPAAP